MAATESRTGFRLPWSTEEKAAGQRTDEPQEADRPTETDAPASEAAEAGPTAEVTAAEPTPDGPSVSVETSAAPSADTGHHEEASVHPTASPASASRPADAAPKRPSKFLADLTRAMQAAAESARATTLEQFQADAKAHIEQVHARSADEAGELRKNADEDIVAIRDWSKAELARIREETDRKITQRKTDLDEELEEHAARIETKIERVQARVAEFEAQMERFFERLMTEDDPAEFAAMAENLPEPPPFDDDSESSSAARATTVERPRASESVAAEPDAVEPAGADDAAEATEATAGTVEVEAEAETLTGTADGQDGTVSTETEPQPAGEAETSDETDRAAVEYAVQDDPAAVEAAMKAIEDSYKAAETGPDSGAATEAAAEPPVEPAAEADPRLAALGLGPDLSAAEAEAEAAAAASTDEEIPTIDDDALAARLAGLIPAAGSAAATPRPATPKAAATVQVVVTGLVSVASIASFKRHLGRVAGVQSVGVSSGPDGEFVFKVAHGADVNLADAIPTLPGFEARVTGSGEGVLNVSARDPESEG